MTKFKQYYRDMSDQNEELFKKFDEIHAGYKSDRKAWSKQFHSVGQEVVDVVREWEKRLCSGMEKSANGVYSMKLAEKFWGEVKQRWSHVEMVGVKSSLD